MDEGTPLLLLEGRPRIGKTTAARRMPLLPREAGVPAVERVALPALHAPGRGGVVVATVQLGGHRFTDALERRPDIRVVRVTEATRDALPEQLAGRLTGERRR